MIWDDRLTRSQNHNMLGHPGAINIILTVVTENLVYDIRYQGSCWKGMIDEHVVEDVGVGLLGHCVPPV